MKLLRLSSLFLAVSILTGCGNGETPAGWEPHNFKLDPDRIYDDVAALASDTYAGREPGTEGNRLACDFVEGLFDELGLDPAGTSGFRQAFDFWSWQLQAAPEMSIAGNSLEPGADYRVVRYAGSGQVETELVFVGYGLRVPPFDPGDFPDCPFDPATGYDDYADLDLDGEIALVVRHGPRDDEAILDACPGDAGCQGTDCLWTFTYKSSRAVAQGADAVIFVQDYRHDGAEIPVVTIGEDGYRPDTPVVFVDRARVEAVLPELETWMEGIDAALAPAGRATGVMAGLSVDAVRSEIQPENVLGVVPGADPELSREVVVIGAHLDHLGTDMSTGDVFYGADDNASGTAVMMELARLTMSLDAQPARTILFAGWNAEEAGLVGSCHYVQNPIYPMANTLATVAIDMVGAGDGTALVLFGGTEPGNEWLVDIMQGSASDERLDWAVYPFVPIAASDHHCFAEAGIPAMMAGTFGTHGTYHTPADTIDGILKQDLQVAAELMWALLRPLAEGTESRYLDQ